MDIVINSFDDTLVELNKVVQIINEKRIESQETIKDNYKENQAENLVLLKYKLEEILHNIDDTYNILNRLYDDETIKERAEDVNRTNLEVKKLIPILVSLKYGINI
jgi:hypothetical protein